MSLKTLDPELLWSHFDNICAIPHPSKHEEKIRQYLIEFATNHNLGFKTDKVGNIVIKKPGTKGRESQKTIVLQSHIDMVPQKNSDKVHDFTQDPIVPRIDGDWVKATGTTLGADNGIGAAAMLAVLEDKNLSHGPIECLFTVDEEDGMTGASELDASMVSGHTLVNLDSEQEGDIYVGCAGGVDAHFNFRYTLIVAKDDLSGLKISVRGLLGGHSGLDINLGRGNANKILARLLQETEKIDNVKIHSFTGGNLRNAIPREAFAEIFVAKNLAGQVQAQLQASFNNIKMELGNIEPNVILECLETNLPKNYIAESDMLLNVITACPHGTVAMSPDIKELVETSTNLAIVKTTHKPNNEGDIQLVSFMRSSSDSALQALMRTHKSLFDIAGFSTTFGNAYSGWKPNMDSKILKLSASIYEEMNGMKPSVKAIHAGLETGYFTKHFPDMDMVSVGPTIRHPHSPDEKVSIPSVKNFWEYLTKIISAFS